MGERIDPLTNIPAEKVEEIVKRFRLDGAVKIKVIRETDVTYTITATFQD